MHSITIATATKASHEYAQVWQLREEVLRQPLGMSLKDEDLSMDAEDLIFIAISGDKVVGCLMLHELSPTLVKLRQMAVYDNWQGKNIGRMLVEAAEKYSFGHGYKKITLHARIVARGFYEKLGYVAHGGTFSEVGIEHVVMEKGL